MKVVLVALHLAPSPQAVPLANAFLKAYLATDEELAGTVEVDLRDFFVTDDLEAVVTAILHDSPFAVGFSLYLWNRRPVCQLVERLRQRRPELAIFAGGPEATADPERLLRSAPFDFLILGEGEVPFVEAMARLARGVSPRGGIGTAFLEGSTFVAQPARAVALLDTIPSPLLHGALDLDRYRGALWQLARGCDFRCDYCYDFKGEHGVRRFSLERVDAELGLLARSQVQQVFVLDSTFNVDSRRAKTILKMIRRRAPHIHFHFEVRAELLDREMAHLFAEISCSLQIGLQSADPAVLKRVRRHFDPVVFAGKIALLNDTGAVFGFDLIYGLPGDTLAQFRRSLDFALGLYPNHLDIFPLAVLPGTALAGRAAAEGLVALADPPYTLVSSAGFPPREMARAALLGCASDIFYSRGKAVAWFAPVVRALRLAPSAFLDAFGGWLKRTVGGEMAEGRFTDEEIWRLQRDFLACSCTGRDAGLLPAILDLVDYNYHYCMALLATPPALPTDRELTMIDLLDQYPVLAPSSRLARFSYDIADLLDAGDLEVRALVDCFSPTGSRAVIYPRAGEVWTETLTESHYRYLELLDGSVRAGEAAASLQMPPEEGGAFLEFALAEGIVAFRPAD